MTARAGGRLAAYARLARTAPDTRGVGVARTLLLSVLVGVLSALGAAALCTLLDLFSWLFLGNVAGIGGEEPHPFPFAPVARGAALVGPLALLFLPMLGGLVSGLLVQRAAPEAAGGGTDAAIEGYHFRGGRVRGVVAPVKALATALVIGTGGSAGGEGPISQIGASLGSTVAGWFRLPVAQRRVLMAAGMGAGVGALFHAPLAGALFAAEILYRDLDLEYEVLVPAIIASVTSNSVFSLLFGFRPLFDMPEIAFSQPRNLLLYLALAGVLALGARFYVWALDEAQTRFARLAAPPALKPMLGGLLAGLCLAALPAAAGTGYGIVQEALRAPAGATAASASALFATLLLAFFVKTAATAFTVGSGGSGGVFGPAIVAGGSLGGAAGLLAAALLPSWDVPVSAFVLVGMAAFFGCSAKTPISSILMVSEMTGNFRLLAPAMWVCILAYLLSRKVSLYRSQLPNRFEAPVHRSALVSGTLGGIRAADVLARRSGRPLATVRPSTPLSQLYDLFARGAQRVFPVTARDGTLLGVVSRRDLESVAEADPVFRQTLMVEDLSLAPHPVVRGAEPLRAVLAKMDADDAEGLVLVSDDAPPRPLAILTHNDIAAAYQAEIATAR